MGLLDRVNGQLPQTPSRRTPQTHSRDGAEPLSLDDWAAYFSFGGLAYPLIQTTMGGVDKERIPVTAIMAQETNSAVFSLIQARVQAFAQTRFQWTRFNGAVSGDLFGTQELAVLENPWPGGHTADLLARMEIDNSIAGNAFMVRPRPDRLARLRPDRVTIVLGSQMDAECPTDAPDIEVAGYFYMPRTGRGVTFMPWEVAHYSTMPDPVFQFLGMSWLTPAIREVQGDSLMNEHKNKYLENAATVNLAIKFDPAVPIDHVRQFKALLEEDHKGAMNAYKTLYLGGGADPVPVGSNMQQLDFAVVQGKGESRLAAAAGVPSSWVGFSEGLQGSSLNAGNFNSARRRFTDGPQPLNARILTPSGWTTMGEICEGTSVIGSDGRPHVVQGVYNQPVQDVYRVDFIDGTWAECSLGHSWTVSRDAKRQRWQTRTLADLMEVGFRAPGRSPTWAVPLSDPVEYAPGPALSVDPYLLGLMIGDGTFIGTPRLASGHEDADETQQRIEPMLPDGVSLRREDRPDGVVFYFTGFATSITHGPGARAIMLALLGNLRGVVCAQKFIPPHCLRASVKDRVALLQGLVDSDGCVTTEGAVRFSNTSPQLLDDVTELVRSLGGMAWRRQCSRGDQEVAISRLPEWIIPVRLLRKRARLRPPTWRRVKSMTGARLMRRSPTRCIKIDSPDSLYVTDGFTLTHNTLMHMWTCAATALEDVLKPPDRGARLWFDTRIPVMREDAQDIAAIQLQEAQVINTLVMQGFDADSVVKAVSNNDWSVLKHSGLTSVQLHPPGSGTPPAPQVTVNSNGNGSSSGNGSTSGNGQVSGTPPGTTHGPMPEGGSL